MLTKIRDKLWIDIEKIIYVKLGENYTKTRCLIISFINENNIVLYSEEDITVFESALEKYYNPPEKNTFQTIPYNLGD